MSKISESGYAFIHSGILENDQVEKILKDAIDILSENFGHDLMKTNFEVNVVKNKEGKKYGHSYAWFDNSKVFNALIGNNLDGTRRFEEVLDEDWVEPEESYEEALEKAEGSWADEADVEDRYTRPTVRKPLEPLVSIPCIKYTEEQKKQVNNESEFGFIEIFETKISERIGKTNTLYSGDIPEWINENILLKKFQKYNKDKVVYMDKKNKIKFTYPIIRIKNKREYRDVKRSCTITFSPMYKNTASFLINLVKRVKFTEGEKEALLFFSQSKSKNY